jgi:hypothetical protein
VSILDLLMVNRRPPGTCESGHSSAPSGQGKATRSERQASAIWRGTPLSGRESQQSVEVGRRDAVGVRDADPPFFAGYGGRRFSKSGRFLPRVAVNGEDVMGWVIVASVTVVSVHRMLACREHLPQ